VSRCLSILSATKDLMVNVAPPCTLTHVLRYTATSTHDDASSSLSQDYLAEHERVQQSVLPDDVYPMVCALMRAWHIGTPTDRQSIAMYMAFFGFDQDAVATDNAADFLDDRSPFVLACRVLQQIGSREQW
jgi:hypothetical protein